MKLDAQTIAILAASELEGDKLRLPPGQLDRKVYVTVNKVIEAMGGQWDRKAKAHLFSVDPTGAIELAIETGEVTRPQEYGFFETPEPLVERMLDEAGVTKGHRVLEPSAGRGRIVRAALRRRAAVTAVEILGPNADAIDLLLPAGDGCQRGDFLAMPTRPMFDAVVMNPPFARQADLRHALHALKCLAPGGTLVSVVSAGVTFRQNSLTASFRDAIYCRHGTIEPLPPLTFRESGTDVNTCLVVVRK